MKYGEKGWSGVAQKAPVVKTKNGSVRGFCRNKNGVFLGIPYGAGCSGEKRFKAPLPAEPWEGVLDCTQYGPIAVQEQMDFKQLPEAIIPVMQEYGNVFTGGISYDKSQEVCSEDCLVLNVVTPGIDEKKRPVLVYIHGGGYMSGSGAVAARICDGLVDEEDLVVVTVNHRLNVFGCLYLGAFDAAYSESGIVTQLDLVLALRWIHDNIAVFGGDPESVTLIGESGGGIKIHCLLAMPEARGLFTRAIIMSGSHPVGVKSQQEGTNEAIAVLQQLGLTQNDWQQLLTMPAAKLLGAIKGLELVQADTTPFIPTPDGIRLPFSTGNGYEVFEASQDMAVIVGSSEEELATNLLNPSLTWEGLRQALMNKENPFLLNLTGLCEADVDEAIQAYRTACGNTKAPWQILVQMASQCHFLGGGSYRAAMARAKGSKAPIWHYSTTFDTPLPGAGNLACAWHTAELPLVFRAVYHRQAEALSRAIAHAFAAFARTGTPETKRLAWPAFTIESEQTMLFDEESGCKDNPYKDIHAVIEKCCQHS